MADLKIIPITQAETVRRKLIRSVGQVLARVGFDAVTPDLVAEESGVSRALLFRHFHGLSGLVKAFAWSGIFWPSAQELIADDAARLQALGPAEVFSTFFKRYLRSLRDRPLTLDILAWETLSRNDLARCLDGVREKTALEFFELLEQDPPQDVDLTALVILMAGGVHFLAVRSRVSRCVGGVDLESDAGWLRVERTIDLMLRRTLGQDGKT